jgi:hypothetical protein
LGRRDRQHGRTARADGGSRGGSAPATAGARPGQQEARAGPIGSRGGARTVARPWEEGGCNSTAVAQMARWAAVLAQGGAKHAAFIGGKPRR